jgi:protein-tyrosine phosphatase
MGVYIQMSAGSIVGEEGFFLKRFCKKAMQRDLLHFVGSDAHNMTDRKVNIAKCAAYIEKIMGAEYRDQIMKTNPTELVERSIEERYGK